MSSMVGNTGFSALKGSTGMKEKRPHGYQRFSLQQFTPDQLKLFQSLFSHLSPDSFLSKLAGGDEETFNEMETPALKQFSGLVGDLGSRFSGMGMGARKSSGFQNTSTQAASNFAQQLQSQRQGLQRQALMDLMGLSHNLLNQRPYEQGYATKTPKNSSGFGGLLGAGVGGAGGFFAGGPAGALQGASLGYNVGSGLF